MNLNKKIRKFTADGIRGYNEAINELVDATNWLSGIRVINGKPITESDQGPVIDLSQVSSTQGQQPWAFDPDGNQAGWSKLTCLNLDLGKAFDVWVWTGQTATNIRNIPWYFDVSGNQAGWLIGAQGELWGTGSYPAGGAMPYQQVKFTQTSSSDNSSPTVWTGNVTNTPIVPPSSPPVLFLRAGTDPYTPAAQSTNPVLPMWMPTLSAPLNPGPPITYEWKITYDGTVIFDITGSANFYNPKIYVPLTTTGWEFDPSGLSGYTKGENAWIYLYNGPISSNTNPPIVQTFTYTASAIVEPDFFGVTLYTG